MKIILIVLICFVLQKHVLTMFSVVMLSEWVTVIWHVNTSTPEINDLHDLQQAGIEIVYFAFWGLHCTLQVCSFNYILVMWVILKPNSLKYLGDIKKKLKVKWSCYRPNVAQRVGWGIALLFHDHGTRGGWVVSSTPRPHFTLGRDLVPILQEAGWAPGPAWMGGKSRPHLDSIPDRPARSQSLYRLSYPAHTRVT